jgi:monomeric sarcosine oxidase
VTPRVVVVGGGTMGLATAWALARRGVAATVIERFEHVHALGSHGGYTRVIRQAYHEGSAYVPLVQEADREWVALGQRRGDALLVRSGLLELGPPDDPEFRAAIEACDAWGVAREIVDGADARARWPFVVPDAWQACFTPSGGYLRVRACMDALRDEAMRAGASFRYGVQVTAIDRERELSVRTDAGDRMVADRVVVAAGCWLPQLLPDLLPGRLARLRRVLVWTRPDPAHEAVLRAMPVWAAFAPRGFFYGFPWNDEGQSGLKLACHVAHGDPSYDEPVDPDAVDRSVHDRDVAPLHDFLAAHLPCGRGPVVAHAVCMYTTTPSWNFVIDRDPADARVVVAGGFSGHGFKFAPAIGRMAAELALDDGAAAQPQLSVARHRA